MKFIVKIRVDEKEQEATRFHHVTLVVDSAYFAIYPLK